MTTEFYSTYFNKTVDIPNPKVCGYKISNSATKKGWSSGLRAGKDNGVAPQKFSRFSTDWEAESKYKCEGNRNWLNKNQRINFIKTKQGQPFSIQRPSFKSGTITQPDKPVPKLGGNERDGMGNRLIVRNNFISPEIRGREVLNFERLQAQDIEQAGVKVQLSDKTLEKLFKVQVPDPTDKKWIEEKTRRIAAGETEEQIKENPPFGRPQRSVNKMVNLGAVGLSVEDKLESIKAAIDQGGANSNNMVGQLIAQVVSVLDDVKKLRNISQTGLQALQDIISKLPIPKTWQQMGFTHSIFSLKQYKEQSGLVNLFLLNNASDYGRTLNYPVEARDVNNDPYALVSLQNISKYLTSAIRSNVRRPGGYLDINRNAIIPLNVAVALVNNGVDNGQLNGQNPPDGPPNNGLWFDDITPAWDYPLTENLPQRVQGTR